MSNKSEKDKQKSTQEKYQAILSELLKQEENKYCVDCDAKGPRWASWNLGVFLCIRCAGIHRNLGVHLSRVKSVNLDSWTAEQMAVVQEIGNGKGRAIYEANLPENFRRPQTDSALEALIRAKYEHKKYMSKTWNSSQPRSTVVAAVPELPSKKDKKRTKPSLSDQITVQEALPQRSTGSAKTASDSSLSGGRTPENRCSVQTAAVPDRKTKDLAGQQLTNSLAVNQKTVSSLPPIELISLASPEIDTKADSVEFGNFLGASVSTTASATSSTVPGASSDLADLDFFSSTSAPVSNGTSNATGISGPASKDDIMALFGPQSNSNMFGVPGGMYMPQQQAAAMGYAVMPNGMPIHNGMQLHNGMPMMQPMMGVAPVMPGMNNSVGQVPVTAPPPYGLFQGYQQMQLPQPGSCQLAPGSGVMWYPQPAAVQQPHQMPAGHTLSNVLWQ